MSFSGLSSGEKIIMSLALCLYYAHDKRQITSYPKLLLLDEVDAPLHPSMSKTFIDTIINTLVEKHGINVIATTHSPTTVSLAPEDSLYIMKPNKSGIHKASKAMALNALTVNLPTLAISYDGRRQVFVESPNDAKLYDTLYRIIKHKLDSERSLEFISTGTVSASGTHEHTGCDIVLNLVKSLIDSGNNTVFGLVDWDGKKTPSKRIEVIGHNKRNGIENIIFDPLLIAALVIRCIPKRITEIGLKDSDTYFGFLLFTPEQIQPIVDNVQKIILAKGDLLGKSVEAFYHGNFSLKLDEDYLKIDDHKLENLLLAAFPELNSITKGRSGSLMQYIADNIIKDQPNFIPNEIEIAFGNLLKGDNH